MTEVRVKQAYVAEKVYTGQNDTGPYEILTVRAPGRYNTKIGICPVNYPSGVGANGAFEVLKIYSVQHRKMQVKTPTTWCQGSVTIKALVKPLGELTNKQLSEITVKPDSVTQFPSLEDLFGKGGD